MTNAIQEQLLKAGLATEEQVKKANAPRRPRKPIKKRQPPRSAKSNQPAKKPGKDGIDLKDAFAARRRKEQKELAQKKAENERRKANKKRVDDLVRKNALDTSKGESEYQFVVGSSIKKIWVTEEQKTDLLNGQVGVTFLGGKRCLIPLAIINEILQLDPKKVISLAAPEEVVGDEEFAVPDDLMW